MTIFDRFVQRLHPALPPRAGLPPDNLAYRTPCPHEAGYAVACHCFDPPTLASRGPQCSPELMRKAEIARKFFVPVPPDNGEDIEDGF